jgi:putative tRNA adenosine deaminase-associated protein
VSYFAAAVVRGADGWSATEIDLGGAADVDEVADRLRDVDAEAEVSLLFVEADDLYLAVLRLDQGEDLRVFGSDVAFAEESRIGALLLGEIEEPAIDLDEEEPSDGDDDEERPGSSEPAAEPVGDADLLADLGVAGPKLLELCAHEGLMPADITAEVCQALGCGDEVEELREG